jgi:hypothetical protein
MLEDHPTRPSLASLLVAFSIGLIVANMAPKTITKPMPARAELKSEPNERGKVRDDFIRRLFAVAISVGFVATLIDMPWVKADRWPTHLEANQLLILLTGLSATVLSWEGYLLSIQRKPLNSGFVRFWIDIALVFTYLFFLITSRRNDLWLPLLAGIFLLYVWWDALTIREHMWSYSRSLATRLSDEQKASLGDIGKVYWRAARNRPGTGRGPIISLSWAMFFGGLAVIDFMSGHNRVIVMAVFAMIGLYLYRKDKVMEVSMGFRLLNIFGLLILAGLYVELPPMCSLPES